MIRETIGGWSVFRDDVDIVQDAVDPEADKGFLPLRLDVDIAGPLVEGIVQQELYCRDDMVVVGLDLVAALQPDILLQVAEIHYR